MNAPLKIDLHTHSDRSDGTLAPAQLVAAAAAAGIEVMALTDHDSISGLDAAREAAARCGIAFVPGVEISASWHAQTIHVLGLWIDPANPALARMLDSQAALRGARLREICVRLEKLGLPGSTLLDAVQAQGGIATRSHLARALVEAGHVKRTDEAFRKYLSRGKPGYAPAAWPALSQVIETIRVAGGVAVLAHPTRYGLSGGARRRLLAAFTTAGGAALEVHSGGNGAQHAQANAALALEYGLAGSVGSDFHGPQFAWNPLGRSLKLPDCITPVWRGLLP